MISKAANDASFQIIERSNFTLAPRGHGSSSWRMCAFSLETWSSCASLRPVSHPMQLLADAPLHLSTGLPLCRYEALQLDSVPVYVWDYDIIVPYQELLNWNEVSLGLVPCLLPSAGMPQLNFVSGRAKVC